jgi:hypothetical protein
MAAGTEIREADLGAHQGAFFLPFPAETGSRGCNPSHRCEISLGLRDLCARNGCRTTWPFARDEATSYDVASALVEHGVLPELTYRLAVQTFGQHGAAELIYLVGLSCLVSVTLNGFDVPVPEPSLT